MLSTKQVSSGKQANDSPAKKLLEWLREYASKRINSRLIDERRSIPPHIVLDLGNRGFLGLQVPPNYGGIGLNNCDALSIIQQLGAIDPTLATFVGVHNALGVRPLMNYGSDKLKDEFLSLVATGRELAAFALTEKGAGSNPQAMSAKARPSGDGRWRLEGSKIWIGSAAWASLINVFVQTFDADGQYLGISGFIIRPENRGLRLGQEALTMGLRGMVQNALYIDDVWVDSNRLLGEVGSGMKSAQDAMMHGRLFITAASIGGMKRCAQLMIRYTERRRISTGLLINNPVTLAKLTEITESIAALETLINQISQLLDDGHNIPAEIYAACKVLGSEFFWEAADSLVQMLGGRGYIETNIAPQLLRDSRILRIYEGPTETLNMFLGSKVSNGSEEIYDFISQSLESPQVANTIKVAVDKVKFYYNSSNLFKEKNKNTLWIYVKIGELIALGILLAAVEYSCKHSDSKTIHNNLTWIKLTFEQKLEGILSGTPTEAVVSDSDQLKKLVFSYTDAIGEIEQTLPGEAHELDELISY
jgi:alkylation response protein AidB-like acyl-CoA dehydrogenase